MCCNKSVLGQIAYWLTIIGGLNWGLVGIGYFFQGNWDVLYLILGSMPIVQYIVYILIGLSAIYTIFGCRKGNCCVSVSTPTPNQ